MARKPNFDFERREREKAKAAKNAEKAEAKKKRAAAGPSEEPTGIDRPDESSEESNR